MPNLYNNDNFRIDFDENAEDIEKQYKVICLAQESCDFECQSYAQAIVAADQFNYTVRGQGGEPEFDIQVEMDDADEYSH